MIDVMNRGRLVVALAAIVLAGCRPKDYVPPPADIVRPPSAIQTADARVFVTNFYTWYKPGETVARTIPELLGDRPEWFTAGLAALLDADEKCKVAAEAICNLDFDPFLDSQDPCPEYQVGGMIPHHDTLGISVFGVCGGVRDTVPAVIAMVVPRDSGWQFANFVYPVERTDLHSILTQEVHR